MRRRYIKSNAISNNLDIDKKNVKSNKKCFFLLSCLTIFLIFFFVIKFVYYNNHQGFYRAVTKSNLPLASSNYDDQRWGLYRPHLYFGLRKRHAQSPLFGLIWYKQPKKVFFNNLIWRHWCNEEDNVQNLWNDCDGKTFGHQNINDNGLRFDTNWYNFKNNQSKLDSSWSAQINVKNTGNSSIAFIFYFVFQDNKTYFNVSPNNFEQDGPILTGVSEKFNNFNFYIQLLKKKNEKNIFSYTTLPINLNNDLTQIDKILLYSMERSSNSFNLRLKNNKLIKKQQNYNFVAFQITVDDVNSIELHYSKAKNDNFLIFDEIFQDKLVNFRKKFNKIFYNNQEKELMEVGKTAFSNLLGGIGFWYGHSLVKSKSFLNKSDIRRYGPLSLFSAVPSKSFFPRGFLWDEGFHNFLIQKFDPLLTLEIISSWLDTMNLDGWIPREMILGTESEAKVPTEFLVQSDSIANPPVIFLVVEKLLRNNMFVINHGSKLRKLYPRLKHWYNWLKSTQIGPLKELGAFQWQGRNSTTIYELNPKTLASGFDDIPRASHPNKEEYHVDLRCWMAIASRVLRILSEQSNDVKFTTIVEKDIYLYNNIDLLDRLHWSKKVNRYCDYGLHSENVRLEKKTKVIQNNLQQREVITQVTRKVITQPKLMLVENVYAYPSLFPFLLKLLPGNSIKLKLILQNLNNENELWSPFGLRSLSKNSPYYLAKNTENDPPYWRGAVWININYLALDALKYYEMDAETTPEIKVMCKDLYKLLKKNIITNIYTQYKITGFFWENYNDQTGKGQGTKSFTGWTALFLNILTDNYN